MPDLFDPDNVDELRAIERLGELSPGEIARVGDYRIMRVGWTRNPLHYLAWRRGAAGLLDRAGRHRPDDSDAYPAAEFRFTTLTEAVARVREEMGIPA